jgi:hypothetical protein
MAHRFSGFEETDVDAAPYSATTSHAVYDNRNSEGYEVPSGTIPHAVYADAESERYEDMDGRRATLHAPPRRLTPPRSARARRSGAMAGDGGNGTPATAAWVKLSIIGAYVLALVALGVAIVALSRDCPCDAASQTINAKADPQPAAAHHLANTTDPESHHTGKAVVDPLPAAASQHLANLTDTVSRLSSGFAEHDSLLTEHASLLQSQQMVLQNTSNIVRELASVSAASVSRLSSGFTTLSSPSIQPSSSPSRWCLAYLLHPTVCLQGI